MRDIPETLADFARQQARKQLIVMLPGEVLRLIAAARDGNPDVLTLVEDIPGATTLKEPT